MTPIVVASLNPVKINATRAGFQAIFPQAAYTVEAVAVASGVAAQPMSDAETLQGAINRASAAHEKTPDAAYSVGIEGGCQLEAADRMSVFAWVVIRNGAGQIGRSRTATFYLPRQVAELVKGGKELGDADDIVFGQQNSKQANGSVGLLTGDVITRQDYYQTAVILALIPFANPAMTF
jgi:inosine/xanthosine triphosphatase